LPSRVRITLTARDERGREVPFVTEARIAIQEPLNSRAVDVQMQPGQPPCGASGQPCCPSGQQQCQGSLKCQSNVCK
jgi:hypothetical protein